MFSHCPCICPGVEASSTPAGSGRPGASAELGAAEPQLDEALRVHSSGVQPEGEAAPAGGVPAHLSQRSLQETAGAVGFLLNLLLVRPQEACLQTQFQHLQYFPVFKICFYNQTTFPTTQFVQKRPSGSGDGSYSF